MVGTRRGKIVSCRMSPKQGSSNMILGVFDDLKRSRVMAVDRNTFYPKNFLVIRWLLYFKCSNSGGNNCVDTRDSSAKIWCEDIKTSGIMCMKPSPSRLTGGCWSPVRMSVFFTTRQVAHSGENRYSFSAVSRIIKSIDAKIEDLSWNNGNTDAK